LAAATFIADLANLESFSSVGFPPQGLFEEVLPLPGRPAAQRMSEPFHIPLFHNAQRIARLQSMCIFHLGVSFFFNHLAGSSHPRVHLRCPASLAQG
jgi:hypothetical protein